MYVDFLKLALINYIEDRSGMQKIFSFQFCRPCNQYQLLEEKRQEQVAYSSRRSNESQNSTETVLSSTSQTTSSGINDLPYALSQSVHHKQQMIEVRRPIAKVSCRKPGQKQNKPDKSKHLEIGPQPITQTSGVAVDNQYQQGQKIKQFRWPKSPGANKNGPNERGFLRNMPLQTVPEKTHIKINFDYRNAEHVKAPLKQSKEDQCVGLVERGRVKIVTSGDQQDVQKQVVRKRTNESSNNMQKQVKFSPQNEVNIYTVKTITEWQPNIDPEGSQEDFNLTINQSSYNITSCHQSYVDILKPEQPTPTQQLYLRNQERIEECSNRVNRAWLRKEKKIMTAFVPSEALGRTNFRTVQTIKSIDNASEGSIVDSTFMRTIAESKELRNLL